MSNVPDSLRYTAEHEWLRLEADGTATIGITDHAQSALGDVTFVDLPKEGASVAKGATFGAVESVKAASDLYAPVAGTVVAVNADLNGSPDLVNRDPYGAAWMIRVKVADASELQGLLDAEAYRKLL
jgi:glycine cleavage system H protein